MQLATRDTIHTAPAVQTLEVTCIIKLDGGDAHEDITHLGSMAGHWQLTRAEVVQKIEDGETSFYLSNASTGQLATLGVVREPGKLPYLRARVEGEWTDDLLSVGQCLGSCKRFA